MKRTLDEHEAFILANASCFYATKFLGRGKYDVRKCATLDEARATAKELGGALVYAYKHPHQVLVNG